MSATVEQHFERKEPAARAIYDRILAAASTIGPFAEDPKKTSIHLNRRSAFAGIRVRRSYLIVTLKASADRSSARVILHQQASAKRWYLDVRISSETEVDTELVSWLRESYDLSG